MAMFKFQQAKEPLVCVERKCGKGKGKIGRFSRFSPNWRSFKINKAGLVSTIYQEHFISYIGKENIAFTQILNMCITHATFFVGVKFCQIHNSVQKGNMNLSEISHFPRHFYGKASGWKNTC